LVLTPGREPLGNGAPRLALGWRGGRCLVLHLPAIFVISAAGLFTCAFAEDRVGLVMDERALLCAIGSAVFGIACIGGVVVFALGAALAVGMPYSFRYRRNMLPATMQAACYLAGYLIIWTMFGAVGEVVMRLIVEAPWLEALAGLVWLGPVEFVVLLWLIANVACAVVFLLLVARASRGARYANR
jgi:hypothetical protein